jgi:hypothetical protein
LIATPRPGSPISALGIIAIMLARASRRRAAAEAAREPLRDWGGSDDWRHPSDRQVRRARQRDGGQYDEVLARRREAAHHMDKQNEIRLRLEAAVEAGEPNAERDLARFLAGRTLSPDARTRASVQRDLRYGAA